MKKLSVLVMILLLSGGILFSEDTQPQIAYRLLDEYVTEKEESSSRKTGGIITLSLGAAVLAGSALMWFWGDDITAAVSEVGQPWEKETKYIVCGSLAGTGIIGIGVGTGLLLAPPRDYRSEYTSVYEAEDPVVQEALAVATIKDLAEEGRRMRIISGWGNLSLTVFTMGAQVAVNISKKREWHVDLGSVFTWQIGTVVTGITSLFTRSDEERLYEKYLAAKQAIYVSTE